MKKNHLLFLALSYLAFFGWLYLQPKPVKPDEQAAPGAIPGQVTTGTQTLNTPVQRRARRRLRR